MNFRPLIPAVATGITFPPQLILKDKRKGPFDVFEGNKQGYDYYNEFFKYGRLNGSFVDSGNFGDCYSNRTCSGIFEVLNSGRADFSLYSVSIDFPSGFDITYNSPVYVGPILTETKISFISMPYQAAYHLNSNILATFEETSWIFYLVQLLVFFSIYFILNLSTSSRANQQILKGRRRKTITMINLYAIYMRQHFSSFKKAHRLAAALTFIVHCSMNFAFIYGSLKAFMVSEYPAKYHSSLEELIKAHKPTDRPPIIFKGLTVQSKLICKDNSVYRRLGHIAKVRSRSELLFISQDVFSGSALVETDSIIKIVRGLFCRSHQASYDLLQDSAPIHKTSSYMVYKPNISHPLQKRLRRLGQMYSESGCHGYYHLRKVAVDASSILTNDPLTLYRCLLTQSMIKWPSTSYNNFDYSHFKRMFAFTLSLAGFAILLFSSELAVGCRRKRKVECQVIHCSSWRIIHARATENKMTKKNSHNNSNEVLGTKIVANQESS